MARYLEAYEHCHDPLELVRLTQVIADLMAQRPRLNVEGGYFVDSYRNEVQTLNEKTELLRELIDMQVDIEKAANEDFRGFAELKYRKIMECVE